MEETTGRNELDMSEDHQKVLDRYKYHVNHATKHCELNRKLGIFFNLAIPLTAAVLTFLITSAPSLSVPDALIGFLGLFLTSLTIVNSAMRPGERFVNLSAICIRLSEWELEFSMAWRNGDAGPCEPMASYLIKKDKELSEIGHSLASKSIPKGVSTSP